MMEAKQAVAFNAQYLNNFSCKPKEFCRLMCSEHRTLQQSFTGLCLEWLKTCAQPDYQYDGRNEQSHLLALALEDSYDSFGHPGDFQNIRLPLV